MPGLARHLRFAAAVVILAAVLTRPDPAAATVFAPGFAGPGLDAGLDASGTAGTSYSVGGGTLTFSQAAGEGNGDVSVTSTLRVSGNFVATVIASGPKLGAADLGLVLGTADFGYTISDVFLNGTSDTVNGNIFQPVFTGLFTPIPVSTLTLSIVRQGNTISDIYNIGAGPVVINTATAPVLAEPVNIGLFLDESFGNTSLHMGAFTHFSISVPIAEPSSLALLVTGLFGLALYSAIRRRRARG
jgi:hypothetical protein